VMFCNLYGSMTVLHITLILESIGITHFSWLLTATVSWSLHLERSTGSAKPKAEFSNTAGGQFLERLVNIQDRWRSLGRHEKSLDLLGLLEAARPNSKELFVTAATAQEGLQRGGAQLPTPKADIYPTPAQIAGHLVATGQDVPCFLLPPSHPLHMPPHILAYSLMSSMASTGDATQAMTIGSQALDGDIDV